MKLSFPVKGVNRILGRSTQPADTCYDALNVLPFDRYGRNRGGQRPGSGFLYPDIGGLTVDSGTTTTIVDAGLAEDGHTEASVFGRVVFAEDTLTADLQGGAYLIDGYDEETDTLNVGTMPASPQAGDTYAIERVLGNTTHAIYDLALTSYYVDTSAIFNFVPLVEVDFTDTGTYANELDIYTLGGNGTTWFTRQSDSTSASSSILRINRAVNPPPGLGSATTGNLVAEYVPTLATGSAYAVEVLYHRNASSGNQEVFIWTRLNSNHSTSEGVGVRFSYNSSGGQVVIRSYTSGTNGNSSVLETINGHFSDPSNFVDRLRVIVQGNDYAVQINGVTHATFSSSDDTTNSRTGLMIEQGGSGGFSYTGNLSRIVAFNVYAITPAGGDSRRPVLAAVSDRTIYSGDPDIGLTPAAGGSQALTLTYGRPESAVYGEYVFYVDGDGQPKRLTTSTNAVDEPAETEGTWPEDCTLIATWRGRLVLARPRTELHNFFFSRLGDPLDFDYSQDDAAAAFAGNTGDIGRIAQPLTCLIPYSNDTMLLGCANSIYVMRGDPAAGGSIDLVTDTVGIYQARSWAKSPDGAVWFVGQGGLYKMFPGEQPQPVSRDIYPQFFEGVNPETHYVDLCWDNTRHGLWVFVTRAATGTSTHLFWDDRNAGFWPQQYPNAVGPLASIYYDAADPDNRALLMGGRDGRIYAQSIHARRDGASTPIASSILMGPVRLAGPTVDALVNSVDLVFGETAPGDDASVWNVNFELRAGATAYQVMDSPTRLIGGNFSTQGRQVSRIARVRGQWFGLRLYNSNDGDYWSFEEATLNAVPAGRTRPRK